MLAERRLRKYLEGDLSAEAAAEIEAWIEKDPEVRALHDKLAAEYEQGPSLFHRKRRETGPRRGSRIRATTLLPGLGALILILVLAQHWYSRPGSNSTFTFAGGNAEDLDLLYRSESGWRYLDANFRAGDSLAFKNSGEGPVYLSVWGIWNRDEEPHAERLYRTDAPLPPGKDSERSASVVAGKDAGALVYLAVFYDSLSSPDLKPESVIRILKEEALPADQAFKGRYQAFAVPRAGASKPGSE